jgi:hypothetical protein
MSATRVSQAAGAASQLGELSVRALNIAVALVVALVAGALLVVTASTLSATFKVQPEHYPFTGAWMAFCLRFVRSDTRWVTACDLACLALCVVAMLSATVR